MTTLLTVSVLLALFRSVGLATVARLVMVPLEPWTWTWISKVADVPKGTTAAVQVTVWAGLL